MKGKTAHQPTVTWDVDLSQRAQEFFAGEMECSRLTGAPLDFEQMKMPLADVAEMARQALVALSGWDVGNFQTVSDCGHLGRLLPEAAGSPLYGKVLLEVLSRCLHTDKEIDVFLAFGADDDGYPTVIAELLTEQIGMLRRVDEIAQERGSLEQYLWPLAQHGMAFRDGPKGQRLDALGELIMDALGSLGRKASARAVLDFLKKNGDGVIDDIDGDGDIFWRRPNGKEETTSFATLNNRISAYRKKLME
ncbi:MAG: hypothetical protein ACOY42_06820 [Pseudomonadota bacterium]